MLTGEFRHSIDAKNRMFVPAKLREELGEHFVIFKGLDNCINVYSQEKWNAFEEQLAALPSKARKVQRFLSQSFSVAEQFTGMAGQYVPLKETLRGFKMILNGECDDIPESFFLFAGSIDDVLAKVK